MSDALIRVSSSLVDSFQSLVEGYESWEIATASATTVVLAGIFYRQLRSSHKSRKDGSSKTVKPFEDIPSPPLYESNFITNSYWQIRGKYPHKMLEWHQRYGPIIRSGNAISVADPDAYRAIYGNAKFKKTEMYEILAPFGMNVFNTADREFHKKRKGLLNPVYGNPALRITEPVIREVGLDVLVQKLDNAVASNDTVNLLDEFHLMTFDVIGFLAFGKRFNMLLGTRHPLLDWIGSNQKYKVVKNAYGPFKMLVPKPESVDKMHDYVINAIQERRAKGYQDDVMQLLFDITDENGRPLDDEEVLAESVLQLSAGSDTTSLSLSWTMYYLMQHPKVVEKLYTELCTVLPTPDLSNLSFEKVRDLPYLDAVITESLRIRPVAGRLLPRYVPEGGCELLGYSIPENTIVGGANYVLHHYKGNFPDPETYNPDRWISADEDKVKRMKKAVLPFGYGIRACLGRNLALLQLKLVISALVRRYEFSYVPGRNMEDFAAGMLRPFDKHVDAKLRKRAH